MNHQKPTLLLLGTPNSEDLKVILEYEKRYGIVLDSGRSRDPIFSLYDNISRADAVIAFPNTHPVHLTSLIAEGEVGHPLLVQIVEIDSRTPIVAKPIVYVGKESEWRSFKEIFTEMRAQTLIREYFDRVVTYLPDLNSAFEHIEKTLPKDLPTTRIQYYKHVTKEADIGIYDQKNARLPMNTTVSFFGSASSKNSNHLVSAHRAAEMCGDNSWNILHGGGDAGVMGALTEAAIAE